MLFMLLLLTACGFHLKGMGQAQVTFKTVQFVEIQGVRADILRTLTQQFQGYGVKVVDSIAQAEVQITFSPTGYAVSRTGISGTGDTTSELIKMTQPFKVMVVATEKSLLDTKAFSLRDRNIQVSQALASDRELQSIQAQMANEIASQIIDRIGRAMLKNSSQAVK